MRRAPPAGGRPGSVPKSWPWATTATGSLGLGSPDKDSKARTLVPLPGPGRDWNQRAGEAFPRWVVTLKGPGAEVGELESRVGEVAAASCIGRWGVWCLHRLSTRRRGDLCNSILFQHCQGYARTQPGQPGRTRAVCRTLRAPRDAAQGQVQPLSERVDHVLGRR